MQGTIYQSVPVHKLAAIERIPNTSKKVKDELGILLYMKAVIDPGN